MIAVGAPAPAGAAPVDPSAAQPVDPVLVAVALPTPGERVGVLRAARRRQAQAVRADQRARRPGKFQGVGLTPAQPRPSFTLTDTKGKTFAFGSTTAGHPTLLYFGYTNCPDVCPETMADAATGAREGAGRGGEADVRRVRDHRRQARHRRGDRAVAGQLLARQPRRTWVGLRGTQAQIDAAQAAAHVTVAEDDGQTHSAQMLLYGPDDYAQVAYLADARRATSRSPMTCR